MKREYVTIMNIWHVIVAAFLVIIPVTQARAAEVDLSVLGVYDDLDVPSDVSACGKVVYVANERSGLQIIDISDPANPRQAGRSSICSGVDVVGGYLYVAEGSGGLHIYDASDPTSPAWISSCPSIKDSLGYDCYSHRVKVEAVRAYLTYSYYRWEDGSEWCGLEVVDVSNPSLPIALGGYDEEPDPGGWGPCYYLWLDIKDQFTYVGSEDGFFQIIDARDPSRPVPVYEADYLWIDGLAVAGNHGYVSGMMAMTLDVTDPANPVEMASDLYDARLCVAGDYLCSFGADGLSMWDVGNPSDPVLAAHHSLPFRGLSSWLDATTDRIYVATGSSLYILDVDGPTDSNRPARIVYVDKDATGASTGISWEDAFTTIQDGIDAAATMDSLGESVEVWVAEGRYNEPRFLMMFGGHGQNIGSLQLRSGVAVYGGFAGTETVRDSRDWFVHETVIDGSRSRGGLPAYHVIIGADDAIIDGFTITGGEANLVYTDEESGGGMLNRFCSPTVASCTFLRNKAFYGGGGIANKGANPRIVNCRFYGNDGGAHAGGVYNDQSSPLIVNCLFVGNQAGEGGAMICRRPAAPRVVNCTFVANQAGVGGALLSPLETELVNAILWANEATMGLGNQVYGAGAAATFSYCSIEGGINGPGFGGEPVIDGGHNLAEDPQFVRMPDPGPDEAWGTIDDDYSDLRLRSISPLIDKGNSAAVPVDVMTDVARRARIMGAAVEIGAYEFGGPIDLWAVDLLRGWHELADGAAVEPGEAIHIRAHTLTANPYLHVLATFGNGDATMVLELDTGGLAYEGVWYPHNAGAEPDGRIDITVCAGHCGECPHDVCVSRWVTMIEDTDKADLLGNDFSVPAPSTDWGTVVQIDFTVLNQGPVSAPATQTAFYLSRDPIIDPAVDVWLGRVDIPALGATGLHVDTTLLVLPVVPPDGFATHGTYYVGMIADATEHVAEDFEHNNMSRGVGIDVAEVTVGQADPGPDDGVLFSDTFDGPALDLSRWTWVTPESGPTFSLVLAPGSCRLMTPDSRAFDCWLNTDQMPRLAYEDIAGNWAIETRLSVPVSLSGSSFDSGIFVRLSTNDYLTHGFTFGGPWLSSARTGTGQFAGAFSADTNVVELRITRTDGDYRFFYRRVGDMQWIQSYELTGITKEPESVGIFTKTWQALSTVADFDFFQIASWP